MQSITRETIRGFVCVPVAIFGKTSLDGSEGERAKARRQAIAVARNAPAFMLPHRRMRCLKVRCFCCVIYALVNGRAEV